MRALLTTSDNHVINPEWDWLFPVRSRANSRPETTALKIVARQVLASTNPSLQVGSKPFSDALAVLSAVDLARGAVQPDGPGRFALAPRYRGRAYPQ